ncbi:MAG: hypothetical protein ABW076_03110 [Candidatus Thiodiazotropha sp.]
MNSLVDTTNRFSRGWQWVSGIMLVFLTLVVFAQGVDPEKFSLDDLEMRHTDELRNSAGAWRESPTSPDGWRSQTQEEPASRISFGYDSGYDELRARNSRPQINQSPSQIKPSTLFRVQW